MTALALPLDWYEVEERGGVSVESSTLTKLLEDVRSHLRSSVSLGAVLEQTANDLVDVFTEASEAGWDGYGAKVVSAEAFVEALIFIKAVPPGVAPPEVVPEPGGEIGLEWSNGAAKTFVVSLSGSSMAVFAGLLGGGTKIHGEARFLGVIPEEISEVLLRHFSTRRSQARAS